MLFHAGGTLAKAKYFGASASTIEKMFYFGGDAGVAFFFVLSGFIITHVHRRDFNQPEKLFAYVRKRAVRIYPSYIVLFLGVYILASLTPSLRDTMPSDALIILKSILLLPQDKDVVGGTGAPVLVVAWSLQYEVIFYAAFAIALISSWTFYVLCAMVLIIVLSQLISGPYAFPLSFFANHLILLFGMGMLAAAAVRSRAQLLNASVISLLAIVAFFAAGIIADLSRDNYSKPMFDLAYGFISAILVFALIRYESGESHLMQGKSLSLLGDSSYALYLIHFPLISILCKLAALILPKTVFGASLALLLVVATCIVAGVIFHVLVERPLLRRLTPNRVRAGF